MTDKEIYDPAVAYPKDENNRPPENTNLMNIFSLERNWIDVWPHIHPTKKGYTFDSQVNEMLIHAEQMRYDRVLLRSSDWVPTKIELIGTKGIEGEFSEVFKEIPLYASDHFGLVTEIVYKEG